MQDTFDFNEEEKEENILLTLQKYIAYWKWFVVSVIISLMGVYTVLRYSTPIYTAEAKILVRDDKKGDLSSGLAAFADMDLLGGGTQNVDNEIEILNSRTLISKVIQRLNLNTVYFRIGNFRDVELYNETLPFELIVKNSSHVFKNKLQSFKIQFISGDSFELSDNVGKEIGVFSADSIINLVEASLIVRKSSYFRGIQKRGAKYAVLILSLIHISEPTRPY